MLTTSYFAKIPLLRGNKISIARITYPQIRKHVDEALASFGPSMKLLSDYKKGNLDWNEYTQRYLKEQKLHYETDPSDFDNLFRQAKDEDVILLCYERYEGPNTNCHRLLLFRFLKEIAKIIHTDVEFVDET